MGGAKHWWFSTTTSASSTGGCRKTRFRTTLTEFDNAQTFSATPSYEALGVLASFTSSPRIQEERPNVLMFIDTMRVRSSTSAQVGFVRCSLRTSDVVDFCFQPSRQVIRELFSTRCCFRALSRSILRTTPTRMLWEILSARFLVPVAFSVELCQSTADVAVKVEVLGNKSVKDFGSC